MFKKIISYFKKLKKQHDYEHRDIGFGITQAQYDRWIQRQYTPSGIETLTNQGGIMPLTGLEPAVPTEYTTNTTQFGSLQPTATTGMETVTHHGVWAGYQTTPAPALEQYDRHYAPVSGGIKYNPERDITKELACALKEMETLRKEIKELREIVAVLEENIVIPESYV